MKTVKNLLSAPADLSSKDLPLREGLRRQLSRYLLRSVPANTRVYTSTPKKPNSAIRKIARVRLSNGMVERRFK